MIVFVHSEKIPCRNAATFFSACGTRAYSSELDSSRERVKETIAIYASD